MSELLKTPIGDSRRKRAKDPIRYRLYLVKSRCKKLGIEFDLEPSDIIIPKKCPVLGVKLIRYSNRGRGNKDRDKLWSIDRFDSSKGYTKDNIWIISQRANIIKNDATLPELETLVEVWKAEEKRRALWF